MINLNVSIRETLASITSKPRTGLDRIGRISRAVGLTLQAKGFNQPLGARCWVERTDGTFLEAEVVGFDGDMTYLMSIGNTRGIAAGMRIIPSGSVAEVKVSDKLLGRVLDGAGRPIDDKTAIKDGKTYSLFSEPCNPLKRAVIDKPLDVGVRAINAMLTVGQGQRIGLFAGSGVGKSILLGMMTKFTTADVVVIGLIGERGREVKEFIENTLGTAGLKKAVVVAAPADESPLMRLHGAMVASSIAEYFRDQGRQVLLLMDSLTRFAQAQREIGLSVGEPPATKGYPPSVFAKLPQLIERAGNGMPGSGSITAFYTVLTEGDDHNDPIADASRAILDGHIVLSRQLAESGQLPAIDIESSISRVMQTIVPEPQIQMLTRVKKYLSLYEKNKDLITMGAYQKGSDPEIDKSIKLRPKITDFINQDLNDKVSFEQSVAELNQLIQEG
jgi:flagellum-specific ATP synthase